MCDVSSIPVAIKKDFLKRNMRSRNRNRNLTGERKRSKLNPRFTKLLPCLCSGSGRRSSSANEMIPSSELIGTKDNSASVYSSQPADENDKKPDSGSIEEAELSLRESGSLNYEEARALLGRFEYQKGNIEAALHVFEGIDIASVTPKIKISLAKRAEPPRKRRSHNYADPPLSAHALGLLLEAIFLKSKSLQILGRYKEAARSCKVILDIVESSLPEGLPENFGADCKLQEILNSAVELLPELWQLADSPQEAILSFRRALLHNWNLDEETIAKIEKEFAIFLLYSGGKEASPPNLRSQMDGSFIPRNNLEEAILLLMILLKKVNLKKIEWDPSVIDHLSYALSISGGLGALGKQLESLIPAVIDRKERYLLLSLCSYGEGDSLSALNLLRNIHKHEDPNCIPALVISSKICGEASGFDSGEEGVILAKRIIHVENKCDEMVGVAYSLLGISFSARARSALTDSERVDRQSEATRSMETAGRLTGMNDSRVVYELCLQNAEQRKLDAALGQAKHLIKLEGGSGIRSWLLLARILSGQKRFVDGETIVNAALDQTGKWEQGELLRTKAKLQIAQGQIKNAIETYTQLLAVLQVQNKSFGTQKKNLEVGVKHHKDLELETWHDLAMVYINLSQWRDAETCLLKSEAINYYSSSRWHITGLIYEAKGLEKEALKAYESALDIDPCHVQSLVSMAMVLTRLGGKPGPVVRSFLTEALRADRMNSWAWYNLGQFYKDEGPMFIKEAVDCFEAASVLKETEPVEPFR